MTGLRVIRAGETSGDTAQTAGMVRSEAISGPQVGARSLWMGTTVMAPASRSGDHHHGASETGIYVVSGHPVFVFRDPATGVADPAGNQPRRLRLGAPGVPHREENPDPGAAAVVVIARSTQEAIVVSVDAL